MMKAEGLVLRHAFVECESEWSIFSRVELETNITYILNFAGRLLPLGKGEYRMIVSPSESLPFLRRSPILRVCYICSCCNILVIKIPSQQIWAYGLAQKEILSALLAANFDLFLFMFR
jgi:hypothetical protein